MLFMGVEVRVERSRSVEFDRFLRALCRISSPSTLVSIATFRRLAAAVARSATGPRK